MQTQPKGNDVWSISSSMHLPSDMQGEDILSACVYWIISNIRNK